MGVVETLPLSKVHLETDAPYCDIRPTHHSHQFLKEESGSESGLYPVLGPNSDLEQQTLSLLKVPPFPESQWTLPYGHSKKFERGKMMKSRNESSRVQEVALVVSRLQKRPLSEVRRVTAANSKRLFGLR